MTKAIILAGGLGSRLYPITADMPKPLVPIMGKAVISHVMKRLYDVGIREAVITLSHGADEIKRYISENGAEGLRVKFFTEDVPLGTAGGAALAAIGFNEDMIVTGGDVLFDLDIDGAIRYHREKSAVATVILSQRSDPCMFGSVLVGEHGEVTGFVEKPSWRSVRGDMISSGIYIISPHVMDLVPRGEFCDFAKDILPKLIGNGLYAYLAKGYFCDIGTPATYLAANMDACDGRIFGISPGDCDSVISKSAVLSESAKITGSVIMDGAFVGDGAVISDSVLCRGSHVGDGVTVCRAVLSPCERIESGQTAKKNESIDAYLRIRSARILRREKLRASGEFSADIAPFDKLLRYTIVGRAIAENGAAHTIGEMIKRGGESRDDGVRLYFDGGYATLCCVGEDEMEITSFAKSGERASEIFSFAEESIKNCFN